MGAVDFEIAPRFMYLWNDDQPRYEVLKGGAGSGKSHQVAMRLLSDLVSIDGCNILVVRKIEKTVKNSCFSLFKQIILEHGMSEDFKITKQPMEIKHKGTKNVVIFAGLDDPEKIKSITAEKGNIEKVWMEEASEFDQEDLDQLSTRLRGRSAIKKQVFITFNPISEEHWLKEAFFDQPLRYQDVRTTTTTHRDNPFLDSDYRSHLESYAATNPFFFAVYCRGEWGSIDDDDTIVPYHKAHQARFRKGVDEDGPLWVGLDVARKGNDSTVCYIRRGMRVLGKRKLQGASSKPVAEMVIRLMSLHRKSSKDRIIINVDATGLGSGAVDMLNLLTEKIHGVEVREIYFGGSAVKNDRYKNAVTEMYFNIRDIVDAMALIESDSELLPELCKRKYDIDKMSQGIFKIEDKDDFRKRIGKSPDSADALVLAFYEEKQHNKDVKKKNRYAGLKHAG